MKSFLVFLLFVPRGTSQLLGDDIQLPPGVSPDTNHPDCYVCGSPTSVITNAFATVDVPPEYDSPLDSFDCSLAVTAGLYGFIPPEFCTLIQTNEDFKEVCGCVETAPTRKPVSQEEETDFGAQGEEGEENETPPMALPGLDEADGPEDSAEDTPVSAANVSSKWFSGTLSLGIAELSMILTVAIAF